MHKRVIALLLANGADINAVDREGKTALLHAAEHGEEHFVRNFELGVDVGVVSGAGETALEIVVARGLIGGGGDGDGGVVEVGRFVRAHEARKMRGG